MEELPMPVPILEKIRKADNLPSLPTVAVRVLQMTQADDLSIPDIADVIQQDPALTAKILRLVNSSLFGMSREISSLPQAMVVLGLRTVKVMVLSFSLVDTMNENKPGGFDYSLYWRRSLTTAVIGRLLAERLQRSLGEEAFVGGLLCDIGILGAVHAARDLYAPALEQYQNSSQTCQEAEQEVLGVTHEQMGGDLLNHWGLPTELYEAVASHHQPISAKTSNQPTHALLTRILRAAAQLADLFVADTHAGQLDTVKQEIVEGLQIGGNILHEVLEKLDAHVKETASLFALEIGETLDYQQIQANAMVQLTNLSMTAELERAQTAQQAEQAKQQVAELNDQNRQLAEQATTDALTGVANRAALEQRLVKDCERCLADHKPIGLIMMDLDRFKKLNDTFGHQTGDEALKLVGSVLHQVVTETQFVARYGGEEFVLLAVDVTARQLRALAEEIRLSVAKLRIPYGKKYIAITISLGAAHMNPDDPELTPKNLLKRADMCLYEAKNNGRNRVVCADSRQAVRQPEGEVIRI